MPFEIFLRVFMRQFKISKKERKINAFYFQQWDMGKFLDSHLYLPLFPQFFIYEYIVLIIRKKCIQRNLFLCSFLRGVNYYDNILNSMKKIKLKINLSYLLSYSPTRCSGQPALFATLIRISGSDSRTEYFSTFLGYSYSQLILRNRQLILLQRVVSYKRRAIWGEIFSPCCSKSFPWPKKSLCINLKIFLLLCCLSEL